MTKRTTAGHTIRIERYQAILTREKVRLTGGTGRDGQDGRTDGQMDRQMYGCTDKP